jgi:pilus assembly protein CpaE
LSEEGTVPEPKIVICHPNEERCREIGEALREQNPELDLTSVTNLSRVVRAVQKRESDIVVAGVDAAEDPTLRAVRNLTENDDLDVGILVVSQNPSRSLLVACMRAGCDEFLEYPIDQDELKEALSHLLQKRVMAGERGGQVTAVYSAKGGTGNTTVATNLAAMIGRALGRPQSASILDLHPQFGDVAMMMDIQEFPRSVADACHDVERMDASLLQGYMTSHDSGASVLPAPLDIEEMDEVDPANLIGVIQQAREVYQHTIMDLPHQFDTVTLAGLDSADQIFLLCDMLLPTIHNTKRAADVLRELEYKESTLKLVINRHYDSREISMQEMSEHIQLPVHWLIPYDSKTCIQAANTGQTVDQVDESCDLARSLDALARTMAGVKIEQKKGGWFFGLG